MIIPTFMYRVWC